MKYSQIPKGIFTLLQKQDSGAMFVFPHTWKRLQLLTTLLEPKWIASVQMEYIF